MNISRLCIAATVLPLASSTRPREQPPNEPENASHGRWPAVRQATDIRDSPLTNKLPNISESDYAPKLCANKADGWQKIRDERGIRIYARTDPGKSFQRLRGEFEMPGTKNDAVEALMNPEHFIDWLDGMREITVRDREPNDDAFTLHAISQEANLLVTTIPAREILLRCERRHGPKDNGSQLTMKMLPSPKESSKNRIYADAFDGEVAITPRGKDTVVVSFSCYFEPGGKLPAWAINRVSAGSVYKSMYNARNRIMDVQNTSS